MYYRLLCMIHSFLFFSFLLGLIFSNCPRLHSCKVGRASCWCLTIHAEPNSHHVSLLDRASSSETVVWTSRGRRGGPESNQPLFHDSTSAKLAVHHAGSFLQPHSHPVGLLDSAQSIVKQWSGPPGGGEEGQSLPTTVSRLHICKVGHRTSRW
jgi:hypothetical protein